MNTQTNQVVSIRTVAEALTLLDEMGFKNVMQPAVISAGKITGDKFKKALLDAVNTEEKRLENQQFIASCLMLSTSGSLKFYNVHQISFNHDLLVKLGIDQGKVIRELMKRYDETKSEQILNEIKNRFDGNVPNNTRVSNPEPIQNTSDESDYTGNYQENHTTAQSTEPYRSLHFFGRDTALCFSDSRTRTSNLATINIDASKLIPGNARTFDWKKAVHFQFTRNELIGVLAVLTGAKPKVEYKSHGQKNDKGFSIEKQDNKYYLNLFSKEGGARGVPITHEEAVNLAVMVIDRLGLGFPDFKKPEFLTVMRLVMQ